MDESIKELGLHGKNVVVIGGSRGLGRALVAAAHAEGAQVLAIARQEAELRKVAEELSGVQVLALDATHESAPARVFAALSPDVLLVCAGAVPHMAPLGEQSWEQFSRNWNSDVKISLFFLQAALTTPLPSGTTIILISSRAAIVGGSPLLGGYAGSKRMQMFLARYAQQEANRRSLGLRFLALAPGNILPETDIGKTAASAEDFASLQTGGQPLVTPDLVANALIELASDPQKSAGKSFLLSGKGMEIVP